MLKLFIDDVRLPPDATWLLARNTFEAVRYLKMYGCPDLISFDHDLGGDDTAMNVVDWIIENHLDGNFDVPKGTRFWVHSANPVGALNIGIKLRNFMNTVVLTK